MIDRPFGSWPVTLRLALVCGVLMVLLGVVASQQVLSRLGQIQDTRLREVAQLHVEALSVALGPFALHKDVWEVYDTLDRARAGSARNRIVFTVVADDRKRVLAATDPLRAPVDSPLDRFADGAVPVEEVTAGTGTPVVKVSAPLTYQGRDVGQVITELDVSDLVAERRKVTIALLAANSAATLILVLAGYVIVARIMEPIELLTSHMGEAGGAPLPIPEGDLPRSETALARLLWNYNFMVGAITARSEAERRLADRERFVSLGRLSSSLAHEINNPLGGLLNAADTIRTYADRPEVVRNSAELLDRGLRHLKDVSRAILEENRLNRNGEALSDADFSDLKLLFEPETGRRRQQLDWQIAESEDRYARFPAAPIRQIALNLLLNASAAADDGGRVMLETRADGDELTLEVTDTGPGIGAAGLERLLTTLPTGPGGGVGLRLVRDLVSDLGGRISHARAEGRTTITVTIPAPAGRPC